MNQVAQHTPEFASQGRAISSAQVETDSQRAMQEVQAAMVIAQKFPRDELRARDRLLRACDRQGLAMSALYSYNRGGAEVTGPSIRLAEAAARAWGNVQFGIREIEQRGDESTVETYCWDLETNTRETRVFVVPHYRYTRSRGKTLLTDPRDIYEHVANNGARRLRACILGIIPGDIVDDGVERCEETLKATADISPDAQKKMVAAFGEFGVKQRDIEQRLGNKLEAIRPAQMVSLRKIFASIRDGMSKPADWFEAPKEQSLADIKGQANGNQPRREAATQSPPPEDPPPINDDDVPPEARGMFGGDS